MPRDVRSIVVCEPQCVHAEHASFNAALLASFEAAFPRATIHFIADPSHRPWVLQERAFTGAHEPPRLRHLEMPVPARDARQWRRLPDELSQMRRILRACASVEADAIVFSSMTSTGLLALSALVASSGARTPVFVFEHSSLADLGEPMSRRPWRRVISRPFVMRLPLPHTITFVALADSITREVARVAPGVASRFRAVDHPYLWPAQGDTKGASGTPQRAHFGALGTIRKDTVTFCGISDEVTAATSGADFSVVGYVSSPAAETLCAKHPHPLLSAVPRRPLARAEFAKRVASLTHVVWVSLPSHYRFVASASFLDAMAHLKPGVYLRNPYVEHYFRELGDIGYLCDTLDDVRATMIEIARAFPHERYRQQVDNIAQGRKRFEPASVGDALSRIVGGA